MYVNLNFIDILVYKKESKFFFIYIGALWWNLQRHLSVASLSPRCYALAVDIMELYGKWELKRQTNNKVNRMLFAQLPGVRNEDTIYRCLREFRQGKLSKAEFNEELKTYKASKNPRVFCPSWVHFCICMKHAIQVFKNFKFCFLARASRGKKYGEDGKKKHKGIFFSSNYGNKCVYQCSMQFWQTIMHCNMKFSIKVNLSVIPLYFFFRNQAPHPQNLERGIWFCWGRKRHLSWNWKTWNPNWLYRKTFRSVIQLLFNTFLNL